MTSAISEFPDLINRKISKVFIKNGKRKMQSDSGTFFVNSGVARKTFGKFKGGKYSIPRKIYGKLL